MGDGVMGDEEGAWGGERNGQDAGDRCPHLPLLWSLLPLLPLGLLAGLLSGILGIGGGLIFAPLLLWLGLDPHQALATSTLAIVPTTFGGTWAHLRNGSLPRRGGLAIAVGAASGGALFSHVGGSLAGWQLLALQAGYYGWLALAIRPQSALRGPGSQALPLLGLAAIGLLAGLAGGLLGLGGGLLMVPAMVQLLAVPIHLAIRFSTLAVLASSAAACLTFVADGRVQLLVGLALGATAALAAQWSASRLSQVPESLLVRLLRGVTLLLAVDCARRALQLLQAG